MKLDIIAIFNKLRIDSSNKNLIVFIIVLKIYIYIEYFSLNLLTILVLFNNILKRFYKPFLIISIKLI